MKPTLAPTVGSIVHYLTDRSDGPLAAIITEVLNDNEAIASGGVSRASKLTVTTTKSSPALSEILRMACANPFNSMLHSIGH